MINLKEKVDDRQRHYAAGSKLTSIVVDQRRLRTAKTNGPDLWPAAGYVFMPDAMHAGSGHHCEKAARRRGCTTRRPDRSVHRGRCILCLCCTLEKISNILL